MNTMANSRDGAKHFANVARYLAAARGDRQLALLLADKTGAKEAVKIVLRSGVPAGAVADVWSAEAAPYQVLEQAFLAALVNAGAFYTVAADAVPLPFRQRLGVGTGVMEAELVGEGKPSPMKAAQLSDLGDGMKPRKVVALTVLT